MGILDKYKRIRPEITNGCLVLFRGTGFVAKVIQGADSAYWNHVGVVVESNGSLFIVDANADGVQADRLSWRISKYSKGDFTIIKPLEYNVMEMSALLKRSDDSWIKYDYKNGIKELFNRKFGMNLKIKLNDKQAICSHNVAQYAINSSIVTDGFKKLSIAYPQDYIRYLNVEKAIQIN